MFAQPAGQRASLQLLQQLCIESPQLGHLETLYAEFLQQSREDAGVCAWTRQWFVLGRPTRDLPLSVKLQPAESDMVRVMWGWQVGDKRWLVLLELFSTQFPSTSFAAL